jgi:hypothetical protein
MERKSKQSLLDTYENFEDIIDNFDSIEEFIDFFDKEKLGIDTWQAKLKALNDLLRSLDISRRAFIQMFDIFLFMSDVYKRNYYLRELITLLKYEEKCVKSNTNYRTRNVRVAKDRQRFFDRKRRGVIR